MPDLHAAPSLRTCAGCGPPPASASRLLMTITHHQHLTICCFVFATPAAPHALPMFGRLLLLKTCVSDGLIANLYATLCR
jgi:hypothetical protein